MGYAVLREAPVRGTARASPRSSSVTPHRDSHGPESARGEPRSATFCRGIMELYIVLPHLRERYRREESDLRLGGKGNS